MQGTGIKVERKRGRGKKRETDEEKERMIRREEGEKEMRHDKSPLPAD